MSVFYAIRGRAKTWRVLFVKPIGEFEPMHWQNRPDNYRVVRVESFKTRGAADAKRFLHNKRLVDHTADTWAVSEVPA